MGHAQLHHFPLAFAITGVLAYDMVKKPRPQKVRAKPVSQGLAANRKGSVVCARFPGGFCSPQVAPMAEYGRRSDTQTSCVKTEGRLSP